MSYNGSSRPLDDLRVPVLSYHGPSIREKEITRRAQSETPEETSDNTLEAGYESDTEDYTEGDKPDFEEVGTRALQIASVFSMCAGIIGAMTCSLVFDNFECSVNIAFASLILPLLRGIFYMDSPDFRFLIFLVFAINASGEIISAVYLLSDQEAMEYLRCRKQANPFIEEMVTDCVESSMGRGKFKPV